VTSGSNAFGIEFTLSNIWALDHANNFKVVAFTLPSPLFLSPSQAQQKLLVNNWIRTNPQLWDYLVDVDAILPSVAAGPEWYIDSEHFTPLGQQVIAQNFLSVLQRGMHNQNTKPMFNYPGSVYVTGNAPLGNAWGGTVGNVTMLGEENTSFGVQALFGNTNGDNNTALGYTGHSPVFRNFFKCGWRPVTDMRSDNGDCPVAITKGSAGFHCAGLHEARTLERRHDFGSPI